METSKSRSDYFFETLELSNHHTPILIRLPSHVNLENIPEPIQNDICRTLNISDLKQETEIEFIESDNLHCKHFVNRIKSIHDAIQFLLDCDKLFNYPYKDQLFDYLTQLKKSCIQHLEKLNTNDISIYQTCLSNYFTAVLSELELFFGLPRKELVEYLTVAEGLSVALKPRPAVCTITNIIGSSSEFIVMIDQPENPFTHSVLLDELRDIKNNYSTNITKKHSEWTVALADWFSVLKPYQQTMIWNFLNKINLDDKDKMTVNGLSSKFRLIPAPSNFGTHTFITYVKNIDDGTLHLTCHTPILRSAHSASRDVDKKLEAVRQVHTTRNIECQLNTVSRLAHNEILQSDKTYVPIVYQTLITPLKEPDDTLEADRLKACDPHHRKFPQLNSNEIEFDLFLTNHAINYGKYVNYTTLDSYSGKEITALLDHIKNNESRLSNRYDKKLFKEASDQLTVALNSKEYYSEFRELYLAALTQIAAMSSGGHNIGSCVSGKDRKAIVTILVTAMLTYYAMSGSLPIMKTVTQVDRDNQITFANLFGIIFCTKHQQLLASQNAPGCFGTKTPDMYLPTFLVEGIHRTLMALNGKNASQFTFNQTKELLNESDRLASNNDLIEIHSVSVPSHLKNLIWLPTKK